MKYLRLGAARGQESGEHFSTIRMNRFERRSIGATSGQSPSDFSSANRMTYLPIGAAQGLDPGEISSSIGAASKHESSEHSPIIQSNRFERRDRQIFKESAAWNFGVKPVGSIMSSGVKGREGSTGLGELEPEPAVTQRPLSTQESLGRLDADSSIHDDPVRVFDSSNLWDGPGVDCRSPQSTLPLRTAALRVPLPVNVGRGQEIEMCNGPGEPTNPASLHTHLKPPPKPLKSRLLLNQE